MIQKINLGAQIGDKTGDGARTAGAKINANFDYIEAKIDIQNGVVVDAGYTLAGTTITMNSGWKTTISAVEYTNPVSVAVSVPLCAAGKTRVDLIVMNTSNTFSRVPGVEVTGSPVTAILPIKTVRVVKLIITDAVVVDFNSSLKFLGSITPSFVFPGVGEAFAIATQSGTYTNQGNVVVAANSFAIISRSATGAFSISQSALDLTSYKKITDNVKIEKWTAKPYLSGEQMNYLGKDWFANVDTLATDVPSVSTKFSERLSIQIYNVSVSKNNYNYTTRDAAREAVPFAIRKKGLTIEYALNGSWVIERYMDYYAEGNMLYFYDLRNWVTLSDKNIFINNFTPIVVNAIKKITLGLFNESLLYFVGEISNYSTFRRLRIDSYNSVTSLTETEATYYITQSTVFVGYEKIDFLADGGKSLKALVNWDEVVSPYANSAPTPKEKHALTGLTESSYINLAKSITNPLLHKDCENDLLKKIIKKLYIYGGDPTHNYIISNVEFQLYRVSFQIKDITTNKIVAFYQNQETFATINDFPNILYLSNQAVEYEGVFAYVEFNINEIKEVFVNSYTTIKQGGINPIVIKTADYLKNFNNEEKTTKKISVRLDGNGDFTTLKDAFKSLLFDATDYNGLTYRIAKTSYDEQVLIELGEGTFLEYNLYFMQFVTLKGQGIGRTILKTDPALIDANLHPILQGAGFNKVQDMTIESTINNYCLHSDNFNRYQYLTQKNTVRLRNRYDNVEFLGSGTQNAMPLGLALSALEETEVNSCIIRRNNGLTNDLLSCHNGPNGDKKIGGGKVVFNHTRFDGKATLIDLANSGGVNYSAVFNHCFADKIDVSPNWSVTFNSKLLPIGSNTISNKDSLF